MHNGFLQVEGEKMSKSLGNFFTIRDLLKDWPGEVLRFNMLRTHYRQPIDWTVQGLKESSTTLERWYGVAEACRIAAHWRCVPFCACRRSQHAARHHRIAQGERYRVGRRIWACSGFSCTQERIAPKLAVDPVEIARAIAARNEARKAKNFKESDRIRDELAAKGIVLKDGPARHDLGGEAMIAALRPILHFPQRGEVEPRSGSGGGKPTACSCSRTWAKPHDQGTRLSLRHDAARRRADARASISRSRTSAPSRSRWMRSASITSKAAGPAPIRPTRASSPIRRRSLARGSPRSA